MRHHLSSGVGSAGDAHDDIVAQQSKDAIVYVTVRTFSGKLQQRPYVKHHREGQEGLNLKLL